MKKLLLSIIAILSVFIMNTTPAYAECSKAQLEKGCVNTSILGENGCSCKSGETAENGEGVKRVLNLVVEIMSIGVGILGVVGITIVGIQYLTAGGSEEKTRKAKRRLVEILIGLALYAVMAALLTWLNVDRQEETSEIKLDTVAAVAE
ncbi:hypothetical protein IKF34_02610 [Candidatus Saccharibacteria bacterium]|nr:hypothetical protein [Candidatus Saccharibacteria bacterium]